MIRVKQVLVAGGAGGIGEGIVQALLAEEGITVVVTSRKPERLAELEERLAPIARRRFTGITADAGEPADAAELVEQVAALGGCDAAIAIFGRGFWTGVPLLHTPLHQWREIIDEMLTSHFTFARAVIPMLAQVPGSCYLAIGGGAAFVPLRDAGLMSIAAAGQLMLTRALALEQGTSPPRIRELVISGPVSTRESRSFAKPHWVTESDVGAVVADIVLRSTSGRAGTRIEGPLVIMGEA